MIKLGKVSVETRGAKISPTSESIFRPQFIG